MSLSYTGKVVLGCAIILVVVGVSALGFVGWGVISGLERSRVEKVAHIRNAEVLRQRLVLNPNKFDKAVAYMNDQLAGTGFLVRYKEKLLAITAEHPFEKDELPTNFFIFESEEKLILGQTLLAENDVLVFDVPGGKVQNPAALNYDPDFIIKNGDELAILTSEGIVKAHAVATKKLTLPYKRQINAKVEKPFVAQGCSGSAVIQVSTGLVVGILETADDSQNAKLIGFKLLDLGKIK